jgi:hypothetical protein
MIPFAAMNRILVSSVIVALAGSMASAETKSWAALKSHVPANSEILISVDLKAMHAASTFGKTLESLPEAGPALVVIKQACGLDPTAVLSDVSASIKTKGDDEIIVALGLDGVDEAKLVACANKLAQLKSKQGKLTTKSGKVTEYTFDDGTSKEMIYAVWPAKDVVVFAAKASDKSGLDPYLNGKAVQGDMATYFNKLSLASTVGWVSAVIGEDHVKGAYGSATYAKGTFTGNLHVVADSAKDATDLAKEANQAIKEELPKMPVDLARVLKAIKVGTAGDNITVDASVAEADLPAAVLAFLK